MKLNITEQLDSRTKWDICAWHYTGKEIEVDDQTAIRWQRITNEYNEMQQEMKAAYRNHEKNRLIAFDEFVEKCADELPEGFGEWWKLSSAAKDYREADCLPAVDSFKDAMKLNWGDIFGDLFFLAGKIERMKTVTQKDVLSDDDLNDIMLSWSGEPNDVLLKQAEAIINSL
jgi:hypothetical protein